MFLDCSMSCNIHNVRGSLIINFGMFMAMEFERISNLINGYIVTGRLVPYIVDYLSYKQDFEDLQTL